MPKNICVYTSDRFLYQKILLDAPEGTSVFPYDAKKEWDICLWDIDSGIAAAPGALTMSRKDGNADISIPFPIGTLTGLIEGDGVRGAPLSVSEEKRCAYLKGEAIKLTEVEFALLYAILKRGGEYAGREELLREVWDGKADAGIINVYIHYLREKLECHGEKIILSSRKQGYKIDGRFLGGEGLCSE